jgi:hypothetical protein
VQFAQAVNDDAPPSAFAQRFLGARSRPRPVRKIGSIVDDGGEPRFKRVEDDSSSPAVESNGRGEYILSDEIDENDFDTPAFLRKQLD